MWPSCAEYARKWPSSPPEKITPGIAVTAADCAGPHPGLSAKDFKTTDGVKAQGGALDGPGAVIVGGTLFVNSGYAFLRAAPGNVLLAFSVDAK